MKTNNNHLGYWKYYSETFGWDESPSFRPLYDSHTRYVLRSAGLSDTQASELMDSGYVCVPYSDVVIDRFYGGALASNDFVSRFRPDQLAGLFGEPRSRAWVRTAHSLKELHQIVDQTQSRSRKPVLFRGQVTNFSVKRTIQVPR
jgi:hypothetical protein